MISVSVVTRTFNRIIFLKRLVSVLENAAMKDLEWIIVNDAPKGDLELMAFVEEVKSRLPFKVRLVESNKANRAAAANLGIRAATKDYIHMLDDDDTIHPGFYKKTIGFLNENPQYGGVCTLSEQVVEKIDNNNSIIELSRRVHYPEVRHISFANLAVTQLFPPAAFVGRRSCFEKVGDLDVTLEVCEDYDLFLRFLCQFDIGVVPETLSAFHRRETGANIPSEWRNAPNAYNHLKYESSVRNKHFRADLAAEKPGLGWLLVLGELTGSMRRFDIMLSMLYKIPFASTIFKKFRK